MDFEPKSKDFDGNKPTQAELGLAWLGLPFSKCKQAVQADRLGSTPSHPSHPSRGKRTSLFNINLK